MGQGINQNGCWKLVSNKNDFIAKFSIVFCYITKKSINTIRLDLNYSDSLHSKFSFMSDFFYFVKFCNVFNLIWLFFFSIIVKVITSVKFTGIRRVQFRKSIFPSYSLIEKYFLLKKICCFIVTFLLKIEIIIFKSIFKQNELNYFNHVAYQLYIKRCFWEI